MKRPSIPILVWVVLGLVGVVALPLVTTWLQIGHSRDALVVETQQTQFLVARTVGEEPARRIRVLDHLVQVTGEVSGFRSGPR